MMSPSSVLVGLLDVVSVIVENESELNQLPLQPFPVGVVIKSQSSCLSPFILYPEYHGQGLYQAVSLKTELSQRCYYGPASTSFILVKV